MHVVEAFVLLQDACRRQVGPGTDANPCALTALALASGRLPGCQSLADVMDAIQAAMRFFDDEGSFPAALAFYEGELRQLLTESAAAA